MPEVGVGGGVRVLFNHEHVFTLGVRVEDGRLFAGVHVDRVLELEHGPERGPEPASQQMGRYSRFVSDEVSTLRFRSPIWVTMESSNALEHRST